MTTLQMHEFALVGAEARLKAIAEEQHAIFAVFPELRDGAAPARRTSSPAPRGRRRQMSAAERKAVSERMTAYWAKRRGEKADHTTSETPKRRKPGGGMSTEARKRQGERMRAYWAQRRAQTQASSDAASADAAAVGAETSSSAKRAPKATRKGGRRAVRNQARKK